jgi:hypothetical protein
MSCRECSEGEFWVERKSVLKIAYQSLKELEWHEDIEITPIDVEVWARFIAGDAG